MGKLASTLSEVSVRPRRDAAERAEWDRLMDAHHYLEFRCRFGGGLRHVAETGTVSVSRCLAGRRPVQGGRAGIPGSAGSQSSSSGACTWWRTTRGSWCCPGTTAATLASRGLSLRRLSASTAAAWCAARPPPRAPAARSSRAPPAARDRRRRAHRHDRAGGTPCHQAWAPSARWSCSWRSFNPRPREGATGVPDNSIRRLKAFQSAPP